MKKLFFLTFLSLALLPAIAQQHHGNRHCGNCPHHKGSLATSHCSASGQNKQANGLTAEIVKAFPTAKSVKKEAKWNSVFDAQKNLLGYAVYSKPASNGIKGYNGETPLMVALSPKQKIVSVTVLDNQETPGYLKRVIDAGLLKSWDGLKVKKACKKKVDTVSGATYSSRSIIQTLQAALGTLSK